MFVKRKKLTNHGVQTSKRTLPTIFHEVAMAFDHVGHVHDQIMHVEIDIFTCKERLDRFGKLDAHQANCLCLDCQILFFVNLAIANIQKPNFKNNEQIVLKQKLMNESTYIHHGRVELAPVSKQFDDAILLDLILLLVANVHKARVNFDFEKGFTL
jgi:hypothetical protein